MCVWVSEWVMTISYLLQRVEVSRLNMNVNMINSLLATEERKASFLILASSHEVEDIMNITDTAPWRRLEWIDRLGQWDRSSVSHPHPSACNVHASSLLSYTFHSTQIISSSAVQLSSVQLQVQLFLKIDSTVGMVVATLTFIRGYWLFFFFSPISNTL
jgi:hypothetical protein